MDQAVILHTLRAMAWARAKGELMSLLETYWNNDEGFEDLDTAITEFIKNIEDNSIGGIG